MDTPDSSQNVLLLFTKDNLAYFSFSSYPTMRLVFSKATSQALRPFRCASILSMSYGKGDG